MRVRRLAVGAVALLAGLMVWTAPAAAQTPPEAAITGVTQVSAGLDHTCARVSSGQVRCAGTNVLNQLGDGTGSQRDRGVLVQNPAGTAVLTGVRQVSAGDQNTCAVLTNGQVRCWGYGGNGGNGTGGTDPAPRPVTVIAVAGSGPLTDVTQVSTGNSTSCARLSTGQVRCWGTGVSGQLGDGQPGHQANRPVAVVNVAGTGALTGVAQVAVNRAWACARLTNGQVRCWGTNNAGLGDGMTTVSTRPIVVRNPTNTGALTRVTQLAVGRHSACAVLESHQVRCWGDNATGELGDGGTTSSAWPVAVRAPSGPGVLTNVTQVAVGGKSANGGDDGIDGGHACARLTSGQVRCWGNNQHGQLGSGVVSSPTLALRPVVVQNPSGSGPLTGVTQVSSYFWNTCARLSSGQVRCWGEDSKQQLGNGPSGYAGFPVTFTT